MKFIKLIEPGTSQVRLRASTINAVRKCLSSHGVWLVKVYCTSFDSPITIQEDDEASATKTLEIIIHAIEKAE